MAKPFLLDCRDVPQAWKILVPEYKSAQYSPLVVNIDQWDDSYALQIEDISEKRATNRWKNYVDLEEMRRVHERLLKDKDASMRFGVKKEGHGYHGDRGDFCLVGAALERVNDVKLDLTLMYRSLELIGGLAYDLTLIQRLGQAFEIEWRRVRIMAARAHVFALKGNSNEKLYPRLREIFSK